MWRLRRYTDFKVSVCKWNVSQALGRRVAGSVNLSVISIEVVVRTTSSLMPKMNIE